MARDNKLTVKQEKFCHKYIECGIASEAYRFAYDNNMTDKQIWEESSKLLSKPKVSQRVAVLQKELASLSCITKQRILSELDAILNSRITDYVDLTTEQVPVRQTKKEIKAGSPIRYVEVQKLVFKDFSRLTEQQVKAIESIKEGRNGIEMKLHGKSWTIERICAMLGYNAPQKVANTDSKGEDVPTFNVDRLFQLIKESRGHE